MLNRLRNPGSTHRNLAALAACAALLLQAFVPTGYMVGSDTSTGGLTFLLCPGQGALPSGHPPLPAAGHADGGPREIDHGEHRGTDSHEIEPCAFALAFAPLLAPTQPQPWQSVSHPVARLSDLRTPPVILFSYPTLTARGPPQDS